MGWRYKRWQKNISVNSGRIRTIIRDKRFEQEMAEIERDVRRADEFLEGGDPSPAAFGSG